MAFKTEANKQLEIDRRCYDLAEHPALPGSGIVYAQEGRQATVYQLVAESGEQYALKVFKPRFRLPSLVGLAEKLAPFASLPGLAVCRRTMLIPQRYSDLLQQHPDLLYAALMPWIDGATWHDVIAERRSLTPAQSLAIARSFLDVLVGMEQQGIAHCDLSGPNVIVDGLEQEGSDENALTVALVDVEQLHAPGLKQPTELTAGSPGYAHRTAEKGLWQPEADRFAAAVMLAEMLGWCDERIRGAAGEESYFDPTEMQQAGERAVLLKAVLQEQWGDPVARLFERAWQSDMLVDCPTMGEWLLALQGSEDQVRHADPHILLIEAGRLEGEGNLAGALAAYERALANCDAGSALHAEIELIIADLQEKHQQEVSALALEQEAVDLVQVKKWAEATAVYKTLLAQTADPDQQKRWQVEAARCEAENELAGLFDDGLAAFERQDWPAARELLTAVVARRPEYTRQGQDAASLLVGIPGQPGPAPSRSRWPVWLIGIGGMGMLAFLMFIVFNGGLAFFIPTLLAETPEVSPTSTPGNTAIATAMQTLTITPQSAFTVTVASDDTLSTATRTPRSTRTTTPTTTATTSVTPTPTSTMLQTGTPTLRPLSTNTPTLPPPFTNTPTLPPPSTNTPPLPPPSTNAPTLPPPTTFTPTQPPPPTSTPSSTPTPELQVPNAPSGVSIRIVQLQSHPTYYVNAFWSDNSDNEEGFNYCWNFDGPPGTGCATAPANYTMSGIPPFIFCQQTAQTFSGTVSVNAYNAAGQSSDASGGGTVTVPACP